MNLKVRRLLERNFQNIGTLPVVISRLLAVLNDPRSSASDLARVIALDQVLSSRLLKLVNSAYYGLVNEVIDIRQAVGLVGYNAIRSFTFCATLFDSFFWKTSGISFEKVKFWEHSIAVGELSKKLAKRFRLPNPEDYFVAGVVHDIGKVFMLQFTAPEFFKALQQANNDNLRFHEVEMTELDFTHTEIGAWVMSHWKLPNLLVECTEKHHLEGKVGRKATPQEVVALADNMAKVLDIGFSGDMKTSPEYDLLKRKYRIKDRWIISIAHKTKKTVDTYARIIRTRDARVS